MLLYLFENKWSFSLVVSLIVASVKCPAPLGLIMSSTRQSCDLQQLILTMIMLECILDFVTECDLCNRRLICFKSEKHFDNIYGYLYSNLCAVVGTGNYKLPEYNTCYNKKSFCFLAQSRWWANYVQLNKCKSQNFSRFCVMQNVLLKAVFNL